MMSLPLLRVATWGTLIVEFGLGTVIWIEEFRWPMLAIGIAFHLMLEVVVNVQLFCWLTIVCLLLFL